MTSIPRTPVNLAELQMKLRSLPIPETSYDLTGETGSGSDEIWVIREISRGWAVFWRERGAEHGWREFESEAEACDYFLRKLRGWPTG